MIRKEYDEAHIRNEFNKLTPSEKVQVLYNALGHMQEYNGRSKIMAVAMGMGYASYDIDFKTYYVKEPIKQDNEKI